MSQRLSDPPQGLEHVLHRMLAKNPERRHQSMKEVQNDLEQLIEDSGRAPMAVAKKIRWAWAAIPAALILVLAAGLVWWPGQEESESPREPLKITPFTTEGGSKGHPRFSPDGERVAYEWDGPERDNTDIYVKALGAGAAPLRLTDDPDQDYGPAWSPDGREIAFTRNGAKAIYLIPSMGGAERKLAELKYTSRDGRGTVNWAPDGKTLIFADSLADSNLPGIVRLPLSTLDKEFLTAPSPGTQGDRYPEFSPDGRHVAFVRSENAQFGGWDLWVLSSEGGEARRLTHLFSDFPRRPTWSQDGNWIFFVSQATGDPSRVNRVNVESGKLEAVAGLGQDVGSTAVWGDRLVFQQQKTFPIDIWRIPASTRQEPNAEKLITSSFTDHNADFSPDGSQIAFCSFRAGSPNNYVCRANGSNPVQITHFPEHSGTPRWSPDGKKIVFDSLHSGNWDLWLVEPEGGPPWQLTHDPSDENMGTWSRDGRWIYFSSRRTGRSEIFRIPSGGGEAVQITDNGGFYAQESRDGEYLYYWKDSERERSIYRRPIKRPGEEEAVVPKINAQRSFALGEEGIYFAPVTYWNKNPDYRIQYMDFRTRATKELFHKQGHFGYLDLAVSPDEKWILFGEAPWEESELMLAENFR